MCGVYLLSFSYQQLALLHNALTVLWLAVPGVVLGLAYLRLWPWALACVLLDVVVMWARTRTLRAARQRQQGRGQCRQARKV